MNIGEPGSIGNVPIRNRIVMAPMISNLADPDGNTNENHIAYLEERAKGGTGLIITEYTYVDSENSRGSRNESGVYSYDFIPKFRRLTERIHMHGSRVFMQLVHAGGKAFLDTNRESPMAPSAVDYVGYTPREMTVNDIDSVVSSFIRAAGFARRANFDGIELHGAHGYLLQEFLSPALNLRSDRYGGSFENRLRIVQDIIDGIRQQEDIALGIRLSLYEDDPDGYGPDYGLKIAESLKGIDYVHFSAGRFAPPGSSSSFYSPRTHILDRLPRKANLTTMVVGSVTSLQDAQKVLEKADFVSVGRAELADPYFAQKLLNDPDTLRPCIRCNQACRDLGFGEVRCTVNPDTGLESVRKPAMRLSGDIAIAGAGVSGLEAALTAAKSGMKVTLFEASDRIGGQLLQIWDRWKKFETGRLVDYYSTVLQRMGVEIITGGKFSGEGLYCLPATVYPDLPDQEEIVIDSNIYRYHDDALRISANHEVIMTERSLSSLDRVRQAAYRDIAEKAGISIVRKADRDPDVSIMQRHQYDILQAMMWGRESFRKYVEGRSSDYL
ncbi:MAG: FAD-dependent oxidoreductase [Thermoplasmataceae archaeon]|jgi:2,4-dienoyl-CoA reductase-like NADH-dependent reductase (Old Yellow Enzyme family)